MSEPQTTTATTPAAPRARRRSFKARTAALMRWLHIYLSMFGLATVLFFSVTGLTLNHPDWAFGSAERTEKAEGDLKPEWVRPAGSPGASGAEAADPESEEDPAAGVAKLEVVEHLRAAHGVRGALAEFRADDEECQVSFKGPGYSAEAFIDRNSGHYELTQLSQGLVAVINDLHKGRDTGPAWSLVIDISAILLMVISLTGLVLLFYLKLRRVAGVAMIALGTIAIVAAVWLGVP